MIKLINNLYNQRIIYLIIILFFAIVLRYNTLFYSYLDDDEGIYILMGYFINKGFLPYIHYWDHQPPLIYYLAALVQKINLDPLIGVRILGTIFVTITSYILFFISEKIFNKKNVSLIVALCYVLLSSIPNLGGCAFNNEIIFNLFSISSFFILIQTFINKNKRKNYYWSGIIIGLGLITKQQVVFDILAFIFMILLISYKKHKINFIFLRIFFYIIGFITPALLFIIFYYYKGHLGDFLDANWFSNIKYIKNEENTYENLRIFILKTSVFVYIIIFPISSFLVSDYNNSNNNHSIFFQLRFKIFYIFWFVVLAWSTTLSKTFYDHYYIQLLPIFSILTGYYLYGIYVIKNNMLKKFGIVIFLVMYLIFFTKNKMFKQALYFEKGYDFLRLPAMYINANKEASDTLYIATGDVVLYRYTEIDIPTKYAFPVHLTNEKYAKAFNIDQFSEIKLILNNKPTWIIVEKGHKFIYRDFENKIIEFYFNKFLENNYKLVKEFYDNRITNTSSRLNEIVREEHLKIYRLNEN
ncbi:MAG: glycosyl transferase family protein [uncultured bacterium]|nr:MAG: glycosyl transferase family protein [uncultured bacterium]